MRQLQVCHSLLSLQNFHIKEINSFTRRSFHISYIKEISIFTGRHSTWASPMNGWRQWHWPWGFTRRVERRSASLWKGTARLSTSACQPSTGWCAGRWDQAAKSKCSRCLHRPHASSSLLTWISVKQDKAWNPEYEHKT